MRKSVYGITGSFLLLGALLACVASNEASAGVNVGIGVNIGPPPIVVPAPPEVVLVPRSNVYFVPGVDFDVFFYNGYWWSPRGDRWYRSRAYNGPWGIVDRRYVPRMFPMTTGTCTLAKGTSPMGNGGDTMGEEGMGKCVVNAMNMVENSAAEGNTEDTVTGINKAVA